MGVESNADEPDPPIQRLRSTLERYPVRLAILFGSQASEKTHSKSDIDIAVELDGLRPGDEGFNDTFFELSAALEQAVGDSDVDVVDVNTLGPDFAAAVFDTGRVLLDDDQRVDELREELTAGRDDRSPKERFDDALRKIDEHLA
jgi:predicted nucleotidyltransferase